MRQLIVTLRDGQRIGYLLQEMRLTSGFLRFTYGAFGKYQSKAIPVELIRSYEVIFIDDAY